MHKMFRDKVTYKGRLLYFSTAATQPVCPVEPGLSFRDLPESKNAVNKALGRTPIFVVEDVLLDETYRLTGTLVQGGREP